MMLETELQKEMGRVTEPATENILTMTDLPLGTIDKILTNAQEFAHTPYWFEKKNVFAANLFFEPSTRTKLSFEAAEKKLGLEVLNFEADTSSVKKGETLYDTVKTIESLGADVVVIRHETDRYFDELAGKINIPMINGGDGCGHHPTQSLLDLLTIKQEFQSFINLNIVVAGDVRHSRVARSNIEALERLGANVFVSGPEEWMEGELRSRYIPMDEAAEMADVMMMLRIQHERHAVQMVAGVEEFHQKYGLTVKRERLMKPGSIIMHPAPVNRNVEIADELVECKRSRIFKQMKNGVAVRMAVLDHVLQLTKGGYKK